MKAILENETHDHEQHTTASVHAPHEDGNTGQGHEEGYEHGVELAEVLRVVFVALAAAAVWFHVWEPFHKVSVIGLAATLIGGYPHLQRSIREHCRAQHDDGAFDDDCARLRAGDRPVLYGAGDYGICAGRGNPRRTDR